MRTTTQRALRRIGAVVAVTSIAAACGGGGDDGGGTATEESADCPIGALDDATEPVELTIWHNFASVPGQVLDEQIEKFNKSQDKVKVEGQFQGVTFEEVQKKVEEGAVDQELPGLVTLEDTKTRWASDSGLFAAADACVDADETVGAQFDDLLPIIRASYEVEDQMYPVSFGVLTALIYYNKGHFADAGLDAEDPPSTLDEIYEAAKAIKAKNPAVTPLVFPTNSWVFEWLLAGVREPLVDKDNGRSGLATKSNLANDRAVELIEFLQKMKKEKLANIIAGPPGSIDHLLAMATQTSSMVIESSQAATIVAGVIEGTLSAQQIEDDLGIAIPAGLKLDIDLGAGPIPGIEEAGKGQVGGAVWYMPNTNSREVQAAAWEFLKFLNEPANQAEWTVRGSYTPAFAAVAEEPLVTDAFANSLGGRWQKTAFEVLTDGVDTSFPGPVIGPYTETREAIRKALDTALLEDGNAREALEAADATIDEELDLYAQDVGAK